MKPVWLIKMSFFWFLLSACAAPPLVIGQARAPVSESDVVVYFMDRPRCHFETVALLEINGGYFSLQRMLSKMKTQAAEIGASGLYLTHAQQLDLREYVGTAKAIRCLSA